MLLSHTGSSRVTAISNVIPATSTWPKRAMVNSICSPVSILPYIGRNHADGFASMDLGVRTWPTRALAFLAFERRPAVRLRLFAPLRAKITSSVRSLAYQS
jgi:hypothetical protein